MHTCPSCIKSTRRELLTGLGAWASLSALARRGDAQVESANVQPRNSATACIFINLSGAPSHLDTFDVKDAAWNPADADIQQYPGGITLSKAFFPTLGKHAADLLLLRSITAWEAEHERGQFYLQTSHPANPAFIAETPHIGAVVGLERGGTGKLPPFIALNGGARGATFLGGRLDPMTAPSNATGFGTLEHNFYGAQSATRFDQRYAMLRELDNRMREAPPDPSIADHLAFFDAARQLMYDPAIADVFRFSNDDNLRYGNTATGRSCIVARNAVRAENGAVFLWVNHGGWDTHQRMFDRGYSPNLYTLTNSLDAAVTALVDDLKASGHFDRTLILMMGEFGRTPGPLNQQDGRDHHKYAMSAAMLGGGVRGGRVIGATDNIGDRVIDPGWHMQRSIYMEDITATLYSALGINWSKSITDTPTGRKFEYVPYALQGTFTAVREVFG